MMLIILLILMQLGDSYCSELYDKIQSLYLKDLLMIPMDITLNEATVLLNSVAIPFYVIAAMAPMARVLVDYIGKKKVFLISFSVLIVGIIICMTTNNWLLFLLGNSLVSFGCSVDIQYIYIVDEFESHRRGTIRGILAAFAALAGMGVALARRISQQWRAVYFIGLIVLVIIIIIMLFCLPKEKHSKMLLKKQAQMTSKKQKKIFSKVQTKLANKKNNIEPDNKSNEKIAVKDIVSYLIPLFVWGIGVSGVNFYNEPLSVVILKDENLVSATIFIQPVVTILVTLFSGYFSDRISRKKVIFADIVISCVGAAVFLGMVPAMNTVIAENNQVISDTIRGIAPIANAALVGIGWGMMIGGYFAATNLMLLVVTEKAPANRIGRVSALSSYCNGAGNAIGMVLTSILGNATNAGVAKMLIIIPVSLLTVVALVNLNRKSQ